MHLRPHSPNEFSNFILRACISSSFGGFSPSLDWLFSVGKGVSFVCVKGGRRSRVVACVISCGFCCCCCCGVTLWFFCIVFVMGLVRVRVCVCGMDVPLGRDNVCMYVVCRYTIPTKSSPLSFRSTYQPICRFSLSHTHTHPIPSHPIPRCPLQNTTPPLPSPLFTKFRIHKLW